MPKSDRQRRRRSVVIPLFAACVAASSGCTSRHDVAATTGQSPVSTATRNLSTSTTSLPAPTSLAMSQTPHPTSPVPVPTSPATSQAVDYVATSVGLDTTTAAGPVSTVTRGPCGWRSGPPARYDHVIWVWMENKNTSAVFDSKQAPFLGEIGSECGRATKYVDGGVHPSLPNYIAATSGGSQGIADDNGPSKHALTVDNIFRQVRAVGKTSRSYNEAMPVACALTSSGRYAVKHNPAAYYVGGDDRVACQRDDVGFDQFAVDLAGNTLAAFSFVTPNLCSDMHDCSVATGDAWLRTFVSTIIDDASYRTGTTVVFIVFDESEGAGTMPFFAVGPSVTPGTEVTATLNHGSLLAFTEDALGISAHLGAAASAPSLAAAFGL